MTPAAHSISSDALDEQIEQAARLMAGARRSVALTGAGLSVESGIPPFRGPGGLWTRYGEPPLDGYQRFLADPARAWRERLEPVEPWAIGLRDTLVAARPNPGHEALAELERQGWLHALITQNIDDLHRQAGSRALLEIHGNHRLVRCIGCNRRSAPESLELDPQDLPPRCAACGGLLKGDTVQFGEPIPCDVLEGCWSAVEQADCMLVVGTSNTVYPAAELPLAVLRGGGAVIEVNPHESDLSPLPTLVARGPGGEVLPRLLDHLLALREQPGTLHPPERAH